MEKTYEKEKKLWKTLVADKQFSALRDHILSEIERNRDLLEQEDNIDARAEIRVLKKIIQLSEMYQNED